MVKAQRVYRLKVRPPLRGSAVAILILPCGIVHLVGLGLAVQKQENPTVSILPVRKNWYVQLKTRRRHRGRADAPRLGKSAEASVGEHCQKSGGPPPPHQMDFRQSVTAGTYCPEWHSSQAVRDKKRAAQQGNRKVNRFCIHGLPLLWDGASITGKGQNSVTGKCRPSFWAASGERNDFIRK